MGQPANPLVRLYAGRGVSLSHPLKLACPVFGGLIAGWA